MRFLNILLTAAVAVAVSALVLTLAVPKAAHANGEAPVKVMNTTSSPAVTAGIDKLASQAYAVFCSPITQQCYDFPSAETLADSTPAVVPAGENFMVTSVEFNFPGATPSGHYALYCGGFTNPHLYGLWDVSTGTLEFVYPSGFKLPVGCGSIRATGYLNASGGSLGNFIVRGYLTAN